MLGISEVVARLQALQSEQPEALVEALCRVDEKSGADTSGLTPVVQLLQELGNDGVATSSTTETSAVEEDPFPGFDNPTRRTTLPTSPLGARAEGNDAVTAALIQTLASYQTVLDHNQRDFDELFARRENNLDNESEDETIARLREVQAVLLKYPVAAQAAFAALVREGRRYADTPDGQTLKRQLAGSSVLAKARTLFEGLAGGLLAEDGATLPSTYIDGFLHALDRDLENVLHDLSSAEKGA